MQSRGYNGFENWDTAECWAWLQNDETLYLLVEDVLDNTTRDKALAVRYAVSNEADAYTLWNVDLDQVNWYEIVEEWEAE